MSIESKIEALTAAVVNLTSMLQSTTVSVQAGTLPAQTQTATVPAAAPAPAAPAAPQMAPAMPAAPAFAAAPVPAAPQMPAPPTFAAPAPAAPVAGAPFSDAKGLMDYVMAKYTALGAEKGAQIQNVLTGLGYANINDVQPGHYAAFYQGVEAIA